MVEITTRPLEDSMIIGIDNNYMIEVLKNKDKTFDVRLVKRVYNKEFSAKNEIDALILFVQRLQDLEVFDNEFQNKVAILKTIFQKIK